MDFRITNLPSTQEKDLIYKELLKYNLNHLEEKDIHELGIFLDDKNGKKTAGLIGKTHGNWLTIDYLWVSEENRDKHIGTELVNKAESIAKERGCKFVFVNTFSFQAPKFYEKLGYKEQFVLTKYPVTGERFYYTKELK